MSGGLGDLFGAFGADNSFEDMLKTPAQKLEDTTRKLAEQRDAREKQAQDSAPVPQMRGKVVNGVKYLRAGDVLAALDATGSATRVGAKIRKWVSG